MACQSQDVYSRRITAQVVLNLLLVARMSIHLRVRLPEASAGMAIWLCDVMLG